VRVALWLCVCSPALAAERVFDFSSVRPGAVPPDFRSSVIGEGAPGDWQVAEVPLQETPAIGLPQSGGAPRLAVVAQLAQDPTDEHFPVLIYEKETFADFTLSAKARTVSGSVEQMAGIVFRMRDEKNFYVLRLSTLGGNVRFYKTVEGVRSAPIAVNVDVPAGRWHELKVQCQGNQIRCWLDGRDLFSTLNDNSFTEGKIGLWTKSDSVSQFRDLKVEYQPRDTLAEQLVREGMEEFGRLVGLKIAAAAPGSSEVKVIASTEPSDVGTLAGESEQRAASEGAIFHGTDSGTTSIVLPLRDRNGDPVAALRVVMKRFPGQTRDNALVRSQPVADWMQRRIRSGRDLFQ
jgi:hypothetical protein